MGYRVRVRDNESSTEILSSNSHFFPTDSNSVTRLEGTPRVASTLKARFRHEVLTLNQRGSEAQSIDIIDFLRTGAHNASLQMANRRRYGVWGHGDGGDFKGEFGRPTKRMT